MRCELWLNPHFSFLQIIFTPTPKSPALSYSKDCIFKNISQDMGKQTKSLQLSRLYKKIQFYSFEKTEASKSSYFWNLDVVVDATTSQKLTIYAALLRVLSRVLLRVLLIVLLRVLRIRLLHLFHFMHNCTSSCAKNEKSVRKKP